MRARFALFPLVAFCILSGCVTPRHMCAAQAECGGTFACVAGRCQADDRALQTAGRGVEIQRDGVRRLVLAPVDAAYVQRGDAAQTKATPPPVFTLGRASDGDAILFLRFELALPPGANVLEAYVLLEREDDVAVDPTPIALHAGGILDPWSARSVSWTHQPRIDDGRATATSVGGARRLARIDVRDLVRHWRLHAKTDQGIAIVAENTSATGITFAFAPAIDDRGMDARDARDPTRRDFAGAPVGVPTMRTPPPSFIFASPDESSAAAGTTEPIGPRLEVYVR